MEFWVFFGEFLKNRLFRDAGWVKDNFERIFAVGDEKHWKAAFTGYLTYASNVHKNIYFLMRDNGFYTKAIQTQFSQRESADRCVQHICIGYLQGWEALDEPTSLICQLINNKDASQLSEIVEFFWRMRERFTDEMKEKVKPLWEELFKVLDVGKESEEYQKVLYSLSRWLLLIDGIDEDVFEWMKLSARFTPQDFQSNDMIESLSKHAETNPDYVAQIYLEVLNNGVYPTFHEEVIQTLVRVLYEKGQEQYADRICNMYLGQGFTLLRDLHEEFRRNESKATSGNAI